MILMKQHLIKTSDETDYVALPNLNEDDYQSCQIIIKNNQTPNFTSVQYINDVLMN